MIGKGTKSGICHAIRQYVKANNRCMRDYDKNKESSHLKYQDVNNLKGWTLAQKVPVSGFKQVENMFQFNKDSVKAKAKTVIQDIFLKLMFSVLKNYMNFIIIYHFYQKK